MVGEQPLGDKLEQDGVVPLEGREDVGIRIEKCKTVVPQVTRPTARLPAGLDRDRGVRGVGHLERGRAALQFAAVMDIGLCLGLHVVHGLDKIVLRERQGHRAGERNQQSPLVGRAQVGDGTPGRVRTGHLP